MMRAAVVGEENRSLPARPVPSERVSVLFKQQIEAGDADIDINGHVFNLVYLHWVLDAAAAHSIHVGWDRKRYEDLGGVFLVYRHEIDYLRPSYAGDQIELRTWVERWSVATSIRWTEIVRVKDDVVLARACTTWAFVRTDNGRPRRIPPELKEAFSKP